MTRSALAAVVIALGGCAYGFAGGGLPSELRTVAVLPFENQTTDPTVAQEANRSVKEAIEQRLGLRDATEARADVVVRGTVRRYEPDQPIGYRGTDGGTGNRGNQVEVSKRLLQIAVELEMIRKDDGSSLLKRKNFSVDAQYDPGREADGRRTAFQFLVDEIVKEAQSQW
jgi:hypothetical protein